MDGKQTDAGQVPGIKSMINSQHIVIFDDNCTLCSYWVSIIQKYDRKNQFRLLGQHSKEGRFLIDKCQLNTDFAKTVVYFHNSRFYIKSGACLHILNNLNNWTKVFYALILVPKPIRDLIYDVIANNRHRFIRNQKTCKLHYKHA